MPQHHRAFGITVAWTLGLLFLGSVVHATESSLACPDWPTCFGSYMPEMTGGVFWEHLHRIVAGGLILLFAGATYMAWKPETGRPWIRWTALAGIGLLIVQSVFGGVTVLMQLPDAISTTHLSLAFVFLGLATVLTVATSQHRERAERGLRAVRPWAIGTAVLTFAQSVLGAAVRHTDSGLVCPDFPTCLGEWIPPMQATEVVIHFSHRVTAVLLVLAVFGLFFVVRKHTDGGTLQRLAAFVVAAVLVQFTLGILSVTTRLAILPVSLHTLGAALMLCALVGMATMTYRPERNVDGAEAPELAGAHGR